MGMMNEYTRVATALTFPGKSEYMFTGRLWINKPWVRILQHLLFWALSFLVFLNLFKVGGKPVEIDYIYTALFHVFILPPVYINLFILIPMLRKTNYWMRYFISIIVIAGLFSWLNYSFFSQWSNSILPGYFFISYFGLFQVAYFFIVYLSLASLLKLSKSWFIVSEIQNELLRAERQKSIQEKELLEMEAMALRAQMNPHFIFNCLNSIKSLIQDDEKEKSVTYLTTFSKLIRTLFNNADKKEISLYDEIETCKLYLQLEAIRFDAKFSYAVNTDESIDLKSIHVPALVIQPFIENAIWHGIMPNGTGGKVLLNVVKNNGSVEIIIDDDGIGREASRLNKPVADIRHQSKGVNLTQSRLELDNLLQQRQAKLDTIDKKDEKGISTGTRVVLSFKESE
jgi:sensor histidine kinase YesM